MEGKSNSIKGESEMLSKIRKYIFKPHIALIIILNKARSKVRVNILQLSTRVRGIRLATGKGIQINQRTVITGKGIIELGSNCSFGFKMGGVL